MKVREKRESLDVTHSAAHGVVYGVEANCNSVSASGGVGDRISCGDLLSCNVLWKSNPIYDDTTYGIFRRDSLFPL